MIEFRKQMKKWTDFSSSAVKPLVWMLFGPLLILMSLAASLPSFYDAFLPFVAILGLPAVWKWRLNALLLILVTFAFYFAFQVFFGTEGLSLWQFGWGCSFALALLISHGSMEELKTHYAEFEKEREKQITELMAALHEHQERSASEKRKIEKEGEKLKEKLAQAQDEADSLMQLAEASRIEADKVYKQNEALSEESLRHHREIESYKQKLSESLKELEETRSVNKTALKESCERLKKLNTARTERAQLELFFDAAQEDFKKFRKVILDQRQQLQDMPAAPKPKAAKKHQLVLETLEKDKSMIKKVYDQIHLDHQKLKTILEKAGETEAKKFEGQLKSKKSELDKTKSELVALEREIFVIKKEMQLEGLAT